MAGMELGVSKSGWPIKAKEAAIKKYEIFHGSAQ
jgi:hypothetical protein